MEPLATRLADVGPGVATGPATGSASGPASGSAGDTDERRSAGPAITVGSGRRIGGGIEVAVLAAAGWIFAEALSLFARTDEGAPAVWLPLGLGVAALLLLPTRRWGWAVAGFVSGGLIGHVLTAHLSWRTPLLMLPGLLAILAIAGVLRRRRIDLSRPAQLAALLALALAAGGLVGLASAGLWRGPTGAQMGSWQAWAFGGLLAVLLVVPPAFALRERDLPATPRQWVRVTLLLVAVLLVAVATFGALLLLSVDAWVLPYLAIPALVRLHSAVGRFLALTIGSVLAYLALLTASRGDLGAAAGESLTAHLIEVQAAVTMALLAVHYIAFLLNQSRGQLTDLEDTAELMEAIFRNSPVATLRVYDIPSGSAEIVAVNPAFVRLTGVPASDAVGTDPLGLINSADVPDLLAAVNQARTLGGIGSSEIRVLLPGGPRILGVSFASLQVQPSRRRRPSVHPDPRTREVVVNVEDLTARRQHEELLTRLALHDALTGLLNRHTLTDRLTTDLQRMERVGGQVGVLFIDLDRFKQVNDTLGHAVGDRLLVEVAERLRGAVRPQDAVARIGGDEFVIVCEGLTAPEQALELAARARDQVLHPVELDGVTVLPTISVGVAVTPDPTMDAAVLLGQADLAMYRAKDAGRDRVELFTPHG